MHCCIIFRELTTAEKIAVGFIRRLTFNVAVRNFKVSKLFDSCRAKNSGTPWFGYSVIVFSTTEDSFKVILELGCKVNQNH